MAFLLLITLRLIIQKTVLRELLLRRSFVQRQLSELQQSTEEVMPRILYERTAGVPALQKFLLRT